MSVKSIVLPKGIISIDPLVLLLKKLSDFIVVGRLLHLTAIFSLVFIYWFWELTSQALIEKEYGYVALYAYLWLYMISIPVFAELDAHSRYQNFKMVRDLFFKYGYKDRFVKSMQYSKCQREAAIFAAKKTGYSELVITYFRKNGKKWFHYFPSFLISNPLFLFTKQFWISTFFVKYYRIKYYEY